MGGWRGLTIGSGWLIPLVLAAFLVVTSVTQPDSRLVQTGLSQPAPALGARLLVNRRAPLDPPFAAGRSLSLESVSGQPVVLYFWASWSELANQEAALMQQLWAEYRARGVVFIGVAVHDSEQNARALIERHRLTFANGIDGDGAIGQRYRLADVPERLFIDRAGTITHRHIGAIDDTTLRAYLNELLR